MPRLSEAQRRAIERAKERRRVKEQRALAIRNGVDLLTLESGPVCKHGFTRCRLCGLGFAPTVQDEPPF